MTTARLYPSLCLSLACTLVLGTACVGFINGDDGSNDEVGDGDGDTGDGGDGDGDTTIYAIQQGEVSEGSLVTVAGVIVTSPVNAKSGLVFVQEPDGGQYSGISLYMWSEVVSSKPLKPGDVVNVTGEYAEFFGMSQLVVKQAANLSVVGSDAVPAPAIVTPAEVARDNSAAEPWEGVLVRVENVSVAEPNDGFGQYLLTGGALVGNAFVDPLPQVQVGGTFSSVTGPLHYSYSEFKIQPTGPSDLAGYQSQVPAEATSIYAIQMGSFPINTVVKVENVVATSSFTWSSGSSATFFVQEPAGGPFSGIQVFVADKAGLTIAPGDQLTIVGNYDEFFDMSQLELEGAAGVTKTGTVAPLEPEVIADPTTIATGGSAAEDYEGVLVRVENVTVVDENPDAPMNFNEFAVTGNLRVDDLFFSMAQWTKPTLGTAFSSITGPLVYSFSNFKLAPRNPADLAN
jgi:predicted extracellular nuclease